MLSPSIRLSLYIQERDGRESGYSSKFSTDMATPGPLNPKFIYYQEPHLHLIKRVGQVKDKGDYLRLEMGWISYVKHINGALGSYRLSQSQMLR
jgi:hypothetical protein